MEALNAEAETDLQLNLLPTSLPLTTRLAFLLPASGLEDDATMFLCIMIFNFQLEGKLTSLLVPVTTPFTTLID